MTNRKYGLSCGGLIRFSVLMVFLLPVFCFSNVAYGATYTASLSTSGTVTINATSQGNGAVVGTDTLTVNSTCPSGYNITIEGPSDTNLYLNGNSSNNTSGTYIAHSTGTTSSPATITGNNLGTWGYSTTSSTGSGTFIGLTNTATTLTSKNSASASGGDTIPVYYGVSIPSTLTPGTYQMPGTSAITYYLTRSDNCVSYLVSFFSNGGSGSMSSQRIYEGQTATLSANTFTPPSGMLFKEWNTASDGSGTSYSNQQSITDIASVGSTVRLYAIWFRPIYMQDMDFGQCTTTPMTVYDKRDLQEYTVARLADGNCWMTKNLNIAGDTALSSADTDVDASYISSFSTSNNLTKSGNKIILPTSSNSGALSDNYSYLYNTGRDTDDCSNPGCYSYYSWDAATLGSGRNISTDNTSAQYSICPKGWSLPTTNSGTDSASDYRALVISYGGLSTMTDYMNNTTPTGESIYNSIKAGTVANFHTTGYYDGYTVFNASYLAEYWSATKQSNTQAYYMFVNPVHGDYGVILQPADATLNGNREMRAVRCVKRDPSLYRKVEKQSKGKQTNNTNTTTGIKVNPTAPSASATVSANSGVYEYDSSVFGADTDGTKSDNTKAKIYYYRGILDSYGNTGTYGSDGLADAYPNYVVLQAGSSIATTDTCWRIIRTTGSGGVKMIYNGLWTGSTCANTQADTQLGATSTFNGAESDDTVARQVVRVGYTHNSTYANTSTTSSTAFTTVMGSNSNYSVNNTDSTIKGNIETWYNNTISDFEDILEPNAGFCNDRYSFTAATGTTATSNIRPYTTSTNTGATYVAYFAGSQRNAQTTKAPSLGCSSGRTTVDIYSTDTSKGGNGQLSAPVGLLTADEASFAGSGRSTAGQGSGYNAKSFLNTGSNYWTMTPYYRYSQYAYNFYMYSNGYMQNGRIDTAYGVRPVISLVEGVAPSSGSGIATDPWVVRKKYMQEVTYNELMAMMPNTGDSAILYDSRDEQQYSVAKLADGNFWMTKNLNLAGGVTLTKEKTNITDDYEYALPASSTSGFNGNSPYVYNSGNTTCSSTSPCYSYYNNAAATTFVNSGVGGVYGHHGDICPKGWKLPTSSNLGALKKAYPAGDSLISSPFNAVYAGYYDKNGFNEGGSYGYFVSSSIYDDGHTTENIYFMFKDSSASVTSANIGWGLSVRCLKK